MLTLDDVAVSALSHFFFLPSKRLPSPEKATNVLIS